MFLLILSKLCYVIDVQGEINVLLLLLSRCASSRSFSLCFVLNGVCFKARINPQFNRAGNLKGVAAFKKETELYPYKHRSKSPTSSTFSFNRLSNSNVKVLTICLRLWCL